MTYEIACSKGSAKAADIKAFLTYTSSTGGQSVLSDLGYAPLPETVRSQGGRLGRRHLLIGRTLNPSETTDSERADG